MGQRINHDRKQRIKLEEHLAKQKVDEVRRKKYEDARADAQRQIEEEIRLIQMKEQEVMQMELIEMELIKKLQNTQAVQKQAFSELETAIQQRAQINEVAGFRTQGSRRGISQNPAGSNRLLPNIFP